MSIKNVWPTVARGRWDKITKWNKLGTHVFENIYPFVRF